MRWSTKHFSINLNRDYWFLGVGNVSISFYHRPRVWTHDKKLLHIMYRGRPSWSPLFKLVTYRIHGIAGPANRW